MVKLIVTSTRASSGLGALLSQFVNLGAPLVNMELGAVHTALQIGNVILEWNNSSLIVPSCCC